MNSNHKIICVARLVIKPENRDLALTIFKDMIEKSQEEKGCLSYTLQQDVENPNAFTFIDCFTDKKAFDIHCQQPHIIDYFDHQLPKITDSIEINLYNPFDISQC